ncbi:MULTISPECIES: ANTAR domain-containing response regulator [Dermacoccus]|uniref:Transcriptional regulator n=1 Tax=Dermacoccus nishinomiyaensis TaxID=1274 RepID=A0A075JF94_9MICO|nr:MULTISPECIES: response regulator [Dermacoccus]AIF40911.1 transcriptional regulator [Dermacoccus nishinomiyaensis]EFP59126.1 response regulator receiver domain protein [Dermacoccus sp. Ellin185]MCG7428477.1 response regulator [Dermacoccus nishinomiyaensis]TCJ91808.1 response regulator receiver and ANTAR domain protein [Dermacoccus sp. SAI-028]STD14440.1 Probable transcriptional regulatory protein pdtaR [Dermacoccus nishinomiyaensis]
MSETSDQDQRLRVVVAEDESLIRLDLVEMLDAGGYDVVAAVSDGEAAVAAIAEHRPDLALLDVKMPRKDGISAAEEIGADGLTPVVLLTAFSDRHLVERASDAGVMAYVVKPFTWNDLGPALTVATRRWREMRALRDELAAINAKLETRKQLDRAKGILTTKLGLDEPAAFRWIQKTAMDRRLSMQQVCDGVIAEFGDA